MRKFECECGNKTFFIDKNRAIAKCSKCFKKYDYNSERWIKSPSPIKKLIGFIFTKKPKPKPKQIEIEHREETLGEFKKRIGAEPPPKHLKKLGSKKIIKEIRKNKPFGKYFEKEERLYKKWEKMLERLKTGKVYISPNEHYGLLRGQSIAKIAKRELRQLGYDLKVKYKNKGAIIWLK